MSSTTEQSVILLQSLSQIGGFVDSLWLEDGLSQNTLGAYRSDLEIFATWLDQQYNKSILEASAVEITAFMAQRRTDKATSANRRLTVLKRFFRYMIRQNLLTEDPCIHLRAAKQAVRFPTTYPKIRWRH